MDCILGEWCRCLMVECGAERCVEGGGFGNLLQSAGNGERSP